MTETMINDNKNAVNKKKTEQQKTSHMFNDLTYET
jgi:hypothetical protein